MTAAFDRLRMLQDDTFRLSNETLAVFRIVFFFTVLVSQTPRSLLWATEYPDWLRDPSPGLMSVVGIPPTPVLIALQWGAIAFAVMGLVGHRTTVASVGYPAVMIIANSVTYSFGKIDHDLLWFAVPLVMSYSGWGNAYALDARQHDTVQKDWALQNSRAIATLYAIIAVAFFTAAAAKLQVWPSLSSSTSADFVRYYRVVQADEAILAALSLRLPDAIWELVDYSTIGIEIAPLVLLFFPRLARKIPLMLMLFHLGVLLTMGINFSLYLLVYIPIAAHPRAGERVDAFADRFSPAAWISLAATACVAGKWVIGPAVGALQGEGALAAFPAIVLFSFHAGLLIAFTLPPSRSDEPAEVGRVRPPHVARSTS